MATIAEVAPVFDDAKAYKPAEINGTWYGDGRELALFDFVYSHPDLESMRGNPAKVLDAIDSFGRSHTGLINVGDDKGQIVTDLITQHKPDTILELGGYVGYSAIMFGHAMKRAGGHKYYSVEKSPLFAAIATSLIDLAGLRDTVQVTVGTGGEGIQHLHDSGQFPSQIGMTFFDHHKPSYTSDLKRCERLNLIGKGTLLVADNIVMPGNPLYLEWVRATVEEKTQLDVKSSEKGNPHLLYHSRFIPSFSPDGEDDALEATTCEGVQA